MVVGEREPPLLPSDAPLGPAMADDGTNGARMKGGAASW